MRSIVAHTFRSASDAEVWNTRRGTVVKATVRVAKGDKSGRGGQFHGATNLRGTERPVAVSAVRATA